MRAREVSESGGRLRRALVVTVLAAALLVAQGALPAGATWQSFFYPQLVSVSSDGVLGNHDSRSPAISADGRYVAFRSRASNLVPGLLGTSHYRIYRHDRLTQETVLVSESTVPDEIVDKDSYEPRISSCGRYVGFISDFSFVAEDTNDAWDIYVRDMETGEYALVDFFGDGSPLPQIWWETIKFTGDASFVIFTSWGQDLLGTGRTSASYNVWGYDLMSEEATLVSVPTTGTAVATQNTYHNDISSDGKYAVFWTHNDWDPADTNNGWDLYVKDMETGELTWVDFYGDGSALENNYGYSLTLSGDGSRIAFDAWHSLLPGDTLAYRDVYSYCLASEEATLVSGPHITDRGSRTPSITDDGRYVAFFTGQPFADDDVNGDQDIYIKDMETGEFIRVPVMGVDALPGSDVRDIVMSGDGEHLVFRDRSGLTPADTNGRDDIYYAPVVRPALSDGPTRLEGANRYQTAVNVSEEAFPLGARTVVIATGENWPDALGGSALAGAVDGPVLLTRSGALTGVTKAELERLGARNAYILGGHDAISPAVELELEALLPGFVWRIGGPDRYATSKAVANRVVELLGHQWDGKACVATGMDFPDAVGAAPLGAGLGWPVVLVWPSDPYVLLPPGTQSTVILGGESAVGPSIEAYLEFILGAGNVDREGGVNRYETSAMAAQYGIDHGLLWNQVGISTGASYPDALTGGVALGLHRSTLLLTPSTSLHGAAAAKLEANKDDIDTVNFLGGNAALDAAVEGQVKMLLGM